MRIPITNKDSTTISPFGYLLLWADGKPENGILHIDFRLGASGEEIRLVDYDLVTAIDSITFGEQVEDKSYGRTGLTDPEWGIMNRPTPLAPNFYVLGGITPVQNDMEVLVFPNPFSQRVTIDWSNIQNSNATNFSIFDPSGRIVFKVGGDRLDTKQIQWDGTNESCSLLGEGIYVYRITIDNEIVSGRILFQK